MSGEKLSLFTSIAVNKQPKTDKQTELVRLITNQVSKSGIGNFSQLVQDLDAAGIVIGKDRIAIKAKQTDIVDNNGNTIAMFSNGKLNASLIDADTITVNHLYAKSSQGGTSVGHFGNYDIDAAKISGVGYPLWLGATTAANAPFRVSQKGAIYSIAGTIGGFEIGSNYIGLQNPGDNVARLYLTDENLIFNKLPNRQTVIGNTQTGSSSGIDGSLLIRNANQNAKHSVDISQTGYSVFDNVGIQLNVSGSTFNTLETGNSKLDAAICAASGMYYGLRPRVRTVTKNETLSDLDHTVYCHNTSADITLTLPSSPKRGQEYLIIQGGNKINISASHEIWGRGANGEKTWYSGTGSQFSFLIFSGDVWRVNYMA